MKIKTMNMYVYIYSLFYTFNFITSDYLIIPVFIHSAGK